MIESELLDNLKAFEFELSDEDMETMKTLNKNLRKIVPIVKLKDGTQELRDQGSFHYPFHKEETEANLKY